MLNGNAVTQKMWILYVQMQLDEEDPLWKERNRRHRKWGTFDEIRSFVRAAPSVRHDVLNMLDDAEKALATSTPNSTSTGAGTAVPSGYIHSE